MHDPARRDRRAFDAEAMVVVFIATAVNPRLGSPREWGLRRSLRRALLVMLFSFGVAAATAWTRPQREALERFEREQGREATRDELKRILLSRQS